MVDSTFITDVMITKCPTTGNKHACNEACNTNHHNKEEFVTRDKEQTSVLPLLHITALPIPPSPMPPYLSPVLLTSTPPFPLLIIESNVYRYIHEIKYYMQCKHIFHMPYQFYYCFINNSTLVYI